MLFDMMSPLARDECVRRLRAKTASPWLPAILSNKPVVGDVENTWFCIRKHVTLNNPFQPHLDGELLDDGGRTRVRCEFGMRLAVVGFMALWFGVLLFLEGKGVIGAIASLLRGDAPARLGDSVAGPAVMLAFGAAFVGLGLFAARNERQFLVAFLRETIDARDASA